MSDFFLILPWIFREVPFAFALYILLLILTVPRILQIKSDATDAVLWLLTVILIPFFGAFLFWIAGDPAMRRPLRRLIRAGALHSLPRHYTLQADDEADYYQMQRLLAQLGESESTLGNDVVMYTDGRDFFADMERDLLAAKHEICMQFYIYRMDGYGKRFASILSAKARAGVKCYFLYDAIGSVGLKAGDLKEMKASGVLVYPFLPLRLLRRRVQINFRNHRKVTLIDRAIAYTGGMNVGEEYAGETGKFPHWFDTHMRLDGPVVPQVMEAFIADWIFSSSARKRELFAETPEWFKVPEPIRAYVRRERGVVQPVSSGPDQPINRMKSMIFFAASRAKRRLWIASPYFAPDDGLVTALTSAAYAGLDVRLLTQNENPDRKLAHLAARYYFEPLIKAGVRIYQYHPGMMHAKMMVVDDFFATMGSANLDVRSMKLNFELNLAFYSQHEIRDVERVFEESFPRSIMLDDSYLRRPWPIRIAENFCRLFAPSL